MFLGVVTCISGLEKTFNFSAGNFLEGEKVMVTFAVSRINSRRHLYSRSSIVGSLIWLFTEGNLDNLDYIQTHDMFS